MKTHAKFFPKGLQQSDYKPQTKRRQTIILMSYFKVNFLCKICSTVFNVCFYCNVHMLQDLQETLKNFHCSDIISNYIQKFECFFFQLLGSLRCFSRLFSCSLFYSKKYHPFQATMLQNESTLTKELKRVSVEM